MISEEHLFLLEEVLGPPDRPDSPGSAHLRAIAALRDACLEENRRRKLLAEAAGLEAEPDEATRAALEWMTGVVEKVRPKDPANPTRTELVLAHIDRQQKRIETLEALLSDAEDTLRARAEGRKAGLLEAAALLDAEVDTGGYWDCDDLEGLAWRMRKIADRGKEEPA